MTIGFLLYRGQSIQWEHTLIFLVSMFLFDLTTTAINNYIDSKDKVQVLDFSRRTSLVILYTLLLLSMLSGVYLVYLTDIIVFFAGGLCFICGILYTFGPIPISRMPLGEIFSGFFYGIMIPFILIYINVPEGTLFTYHISFETIAFEVKIVPVIALLLFAVTPFCTTANIMLANNICDLEKDITVKRFTLPYYIGKKALILFAGLYYVTYGAVILMVIFKMLSPLCLFSLISIFWVQKNINKFLKKQEKAVTFTCAIKNFIIIMGTNTVFIFLSILI